MKKLGRSDYPLAETHGDHIRGPHGVALDDITLESILTEDVGIKDLRITAEALHGQAAIARAVGRETLAQNFERGAELIDVPQTVIMQTYELLRPGRVSTRSTLTAHAERLRQDYGATQVAAFVERAAEIYSRRGLVRDE